MALVAFRVRGPGRGGAPGVRDGRPRERRGVQNRRSAIHRGRETFSLRLATQVPRSRVLPLGLEKTAAMLLTNPNLSDAGVY